MPDEMPPVTLESLYAPFADHSDQPSAELLPPEALPQPYHDLLHHPHHMTVTVEKHFGDAVDVRVLDRILRGDHYARKIMLHLRSTRQPVQFGIVHVDLSILAPSVRADIVSERIPLGRALITHGVLREVHPTGFLRVNLSEPMAAWFEARPGTETFGRIGVITANGQRAVWVAEILAPNLRRASPS